MKTKLYVVAGIVCFSLSACQSNDEPLNPDFGNSVRHNMSVQIINPAPTYPTTGAPGMTGPRARGVMERYDKGEVIAPDVTRTSEFGED